MSRFCELIDNSDVVFFSILIICVFAAWTLKTRVR